jgi:hypothetical protein
MLQVGQRRLLALRLRDVSKGKVSLCQVLGQSAEMVKFRESCAAMPHSSRGLSATLGGKWNESSGAYNG